MIQLIAFLPYVRLRWKRGGGSFCRLKCGHIVVIFANHMHVLCGIWKDLIKRMCYDNFELCGQENSRHCSRFNNRHTLDACNFCILTHFHVSVQHRTPRPS